MNVEEILSAAPVIPVIVIEDAAQAKPLAQALVAGGLRVLEVTLRTDAAMDAIARMREVPGAFVGAGTVLDTKQMQACIDLGVEFMVSPGLTPTLARAARYAGVPLLPGVATASEVMLAREAGFRHLKFFPAEQAGGAAALKGFASVFGGVRFCPTGGIHAENARRYLELPNVACVGGSWVAPVEKVKAGDWAGITALAKAAASLRA